jgi:hypothetical protein
MKITRRAWPLTGAAVAACLILVVPTPAMAATHAAKPAGGGHGGGSGGGTSTTGYDISWPQCSPAGSTTTVTLPSGQAFGIVGLNGGLADDPNSCFGAEFSWAQSSTVVAGGYSAAAIYLNTADPGQSYNGTPIPDWPKSGSSSYGTCQPDSSGMGANSPACAYQYGYTMATNDVTQAESVAGATNVAGVPWWLDVETGNTWQTGTNGIEMNVADLVGMEQALEANGITAGAGVYSTSYQWGVITGPDTTHFNGVPDWIPGARTERGAKSNCGLTPFTGGSSKVTLTQWTGTFDNDYYCG